MKNNQLLSTILMLMFLFVALNSLGFAAIRISYKDFTQDIGPQREPVISVKFLATQNDSPILLTESNTKLIQAGLKLDNSLKIDAPDADGYQFATWHSTLAIEEIDYGNPMGYPYVAEPKTFFEIVVTHNDEVGSRELPVCYGLGLNLRFTYNINGGRDLNLQEIVFDPRRDFFQFDFACYTNPGPWLDSVTFTNPNFRLTWSGNSQTDVGRPPKWLFPGIKYFMTVSYDRPADNPFSIDYMIFHFAGGIKFRMPLKTRDYALDVAPTLKLLSPVGNEKLAPCDTFEIKWEGQSPDHWVHIQYSNDNKSTWRHVASVQGHLNSYMWHVPNTAGRNCFIRISQDFIAPYGRKQLVYGMSDMNNANFNQEATRALTVSNTGDILEWDIFSQGIQTILTIINVPNNEQIVYVNYLVNNERFIALDNKNKELLFINSGDTSISKSVALPNNFSASSFIVDSKHRFICVKPDKYDNKLLFLDTAGNFILHYADSLPIIDCCINENEDIAYVVLLDNTIKLLSLSNFPQIDVKDVLTYAKNNFNIIENLTVSQDARLIATTFKHYTDVKGNNPRLGENIIYDSKNNVLFKSLRTNNTTALGLAFNPAGTLAILGHNSNVAQIRILDLTDDSGMEPIQFNIFNVYVGEPNHLLGFTVAKTGNALLAWSQFSEYPGNCVYINFTLPEATTSKIPFAIIEPQLTLTYDINFDTLIIGTEKDYTFPAIVCNTGEIDATFQKIAFSNSTFEFIKSPELPLFLRIGECQEIALTVAPLDTGNLRGELIFTACSKNYTFPISVIGLNRKLTLFNNPLDLGEACLDITSSFKVELFRNDDTVDVIINSIYLENDLYFKVVSFARDTILKPGEIFVAELSFRPIRREKLTTQLVICHSNQTNVKLNLQVIATGVGFAHTVSHRILPFIPEIRNRSFTIQNNETTSLRIDSIGLSPEGLYAVTTPLPLSIAPEQTIPIEIEYLGDTIRNASLKLFLSPCAPSDEITLVPYRAYILLSIPQVEANPKDMEVVIPVNFTQNESVSYKGERFFYSDFAINPRIFYPKYVESQFGKAELIKNEVINDKRFFGIKITGDFDARDGELVQIKGVAGLCETDSSPIEFVAVSQFFGDSVNVTTSNGIFQLIELCPDRFIRINNAKLFFESISPNPTPNEAAIIYEIFETIEDDVIFEVFDFVGNKLFSEVIANEQGRHSKVLNFANLTQGSYRVLIKFENEIQSYNLNIIR